MSYHRNKDGSLNYKSILVYVITGILVPLLSAICIFIYNDIYNDIDDNTTSLEKKVDNDTLMLMLENQSLMIKSNDDKFNELQSQINRISIAPSIIYNKDDNEFTLGGARYE